MKRMLILIFVFASVLGGTYSEEEQEFDLLLNMLESEKSIKAYNRIEEIKKLEKILCANEVHPQFNEKIREWLRIRKEIGAKDKLAQLAERDSD